MAFFHEFIHIERLDSPECEGLLNGRVFISPKIDGTNACVWYDPGDEKVYAGSRKRVLSIEDDNAGFCEWAMTGKNGNQTEQVRLITLAMNMPKCQIFGEWLGTKKFIGHIKDYDTSALGCLWIYDIYNMETRKYFTPNEVLDICEAADLSQWCLPQIPADNPTMDDIITMAENNTFLLASANHPGEGLVVRRPDFINAAGHYMVGKFVRDEYKQKKHAPKVQLDPADVINGIVTEFVTDAELSKAKAKTALYFNEDEFDRRQGKMVGFYLNEVVQSCIFDEIKNIVKKFKNPVIDFSLLQGVTKQKAREYIGLG